MCEKLQDAAEAVEPVPSTIQHEYEGFLIGIQVFLNESKLVYHLINSLDAKRIWVYRCIHTCVPTSV